MVDSNQLASLGIALQYDFKDFFTNLTGVELAAEVREAIIQNVTYLGENITELVSSLVQQNLSNAEAIELLGGFEELDHSRWPLLAAPWITLTIVAGLFVIMRVFTRMRYCGGLQRDDWFLIAAMAN
ncbi:hypothetical protein ABW20_dc0103113 [Dactylellina cionopaga]|nr:hypothetical protein ABW20_dc0103113 [Dactylellina cionopaga]